MKKKFKQKGYAAESLMMLVIVVGALLISGIFLNINNPTIRANSPANAGAICCDSGDGASCKPLVDAQHPVLTYINPTLGTQQYGLLKSGFSMENPCHLIKTTQTYNGNPIIVSMSEQLQGECGGKGQLDQLDGGDCVAIPNDEIIYVCKSGCYDTPAAYKQKLQGICNEVTTNINPYGDNNTVFDAYFRIADYPNPGVPKVISSCQPFVTGTQVQSSNSGTIITQPYVEHASEQLHTFQFTSPAPQQSVIDSFEPYCKPAIYLYPQQTENVHVSLNPKGNILISIPQYPTTGWDVLAHTDGTIDYQNKIYPYLYYEVAMPDSVLNNDYENNGYVVSYSHLSNLFKSILPQLGLNENERDQFSTYWLKALPKSPYYKVTVVPQTLLDTISPLAITPNPETIIRVTLNFQPLDHSLIISPPDLQTIHRSGFTVVEWGGLYKKDKNHPFTCLQ